MSRLKNQAWRPFRKESAVRIREMRRVVLAAALLFWAGPAWAQSRPLVTEDPETVGPGQVLFESGIDFLQDQFYPASGLRGRLLRVGSFGFSFGVSSMAEIQV